MRRTGHVNRMSAAVAAASLPWLALLVAAPAPALDPGWPIGSYVRRAWLVADGLPQATIMAIAQTKDGYLWLGTQAGLARFDGTRFTVFNTANGLSDDDVVCLLADDDGGLWIGTRNAGLVHRDKRGGFWQYSTAQGLTSNFVRCLGLSHTGTLWIGTDDGGLNALAGGHLTSFGAREGLSITRVRCLLEDTAGNLWIGGDAGQLACRTKDGHFTAFPVTERLRGKAITCLYGDPADGMWVGFRNGGVLVFRGGRFSSAPEAMKALSGQTVWTMLKDREGSLWIGSNNGLGRWCRDELTFYRESGGLSNDFVLSLAEDDRGTLWAGTFLGLNQFLETGFSNLTTTDGLANNLVSCVREDVKGNLWIGTATRALLTHLTSEGKATVYAPKDGLPDAAVQAILEDIKGRLWVGTWGDGLSRLEGDVFKTFTVTDGLASNLVRCLFEDRDGALWIGASDRGLTRLSGGRFHVFTTRDGLSSNSVTSITQSRDGSLWAATDGGGLCRLANGRWTTYGPAEGFTPKRPDAVYEDASGVLWIATIGDGLFRFKDGHFAGFGRRNGLPNEIYSLLEDDRGRFWMASGHGLLSVPRRDLEALFDGQSRSVTCTAYGTADGMRSSECVGGSSPATWKTRDGRLLFPTTGGLVIVDPSRIEGQRAAPPVIIEEAVADGEQVPLTTRAELPARVRRLEVRYTAIDLRAPEKVRFQVLLHGLDRDWVDVADRREAFFTRLPHGRYTLEVRACSSAGAWPPRGAAWTFEVAPVLYQRPVFFVVAALALAGGFLGVHGLLVQRLRARNAVLSERSRMARDIHDSLAQVLTAARLQLASAQKKLATASAEAQGHLERARELMTEGIDAARRAVAAVRPLALEHGGLTGALRMMASSIGENTGVVMSVVSTGRTRALAPDVEDDLWHIAEEAITNAIRHARCKNVAVTLDHGRRAVRLAVSDDGSGFTLPPPGRSLSGFGLKGMHERAAARGWRLTVDSSPGAGTTIAVEVPLLGWRARARWHGVGPSPWRSRP